MPNQVYKAVQIKPLNGVLDARSIADQIPFGGYRWVQATTMNSQGKVCRSTGLEKVFAEVSNYNNADLHDPLFNYTRQPFNMLFQGVSERGISQLFGGTQNRIYVNNGTTGNWRVISDQYGGDTSLVCVDRPWKAAQLRNTVLFTNGMDPVIYHVMGQPSMETGSQAVTTIPQLAVIGLTKAQCICSWRGLMILGNVVMDGVRADDRVIWSDFKNPLSWKPAANKSLAGYHDLGENESILAMEPLGDTLVIYTTKSIWEVLVVGGTEVLGFRQKFTEPRGSNACLAYPRTLISLGDEHIYWGRDGIYVNSPYAPRPERVEWMHRASSIIFDDLESGLCSVHNGGYDSLNKLAWWSWARKGETCPSQTMRFNTQYPFADYLPYGFTAFCNYQPDRPRLIRDWLIENCICTQAALEALAINDREGGFCPGSQPHYDLTCLFTPTSIHSDAGLDIGDGTLSENYTAEAAVHSLSALLGSQTIEDLCSVELSADECNAEMRFVMAAAHDGCIKQTSDSYFVEFCTGFTDCGTYERNGYDTILRSGPMDFRAPSDLKNIRMFLVDFVANMQSTPAELQLRIGSSHQPGDPNTDECSIIWRQQKSKPLACASSKSGVQHLAANTRPNLGTQWPLFVEGRYLYWELKISGTGGGACFGSVTLDVALKPVT